MGIEEKILQIKKEEGIAEGKAEAKVEEVQNLITKLGLDDAKAADIAGVSLAFVQQLRATIEGAGKN